MLNEKWEEYSHRKQQWIDEHPEASKEELEQFVRELIDELDI